MNPAIQDQFTNLPVSRQRKYQLRQTQRGLCTECTNPVTPGGTRCLQHLISYREKQRAAKGAKRRYQNSLSYRLASESVAQLAAPLGASSPVTRHS